MGAGPARMVGYTACDDGLVRHLGSLDQWHSHEDWRRRQRWLQPVEVGEGPGREAVLLQRARTQCPQPGRRDLRRNARALVQHTRVHRLEEPDARCHRAGLGDAQAEPAPVGRVLPAAKRCMQSHERYHAPVPAGTGKHDDAGMHRYRSRRGSATALHR